MFWEVMEKILDKKNNIFNDPPVDTSALLDVSTDEKIVERIETIVSAQTKTIAILRTNSIIIHRQIICWAIISNDNSTNKVVGMISVDESPTLSRVDELDPTKYKFCKYEVCK